MVFKRPGNSRDDKSNGSTGRTSKGDGQSKKTGSSRSGKPVSTSKLKRNHYSADASGEQKNAPSVRKRKPYSGRPDTEERPPRRPASDGNSYRGKSNSGERPARTFKSDASGEKKSFKPGNAPYSGRPDAEERPSRRPASDGSLYRGKSTSGERASRTFKSDAPGERKNFKPGSAPYSGRQVPVSDEGPERNPDSYRGDVESGNEKKFSEKPGFKSAERSTDKKFSSRSPENGRFKKRDDDSGYKPFRKSENSSYNKTSFKTERSAEDKPLRGRKKTHDADKGLIRLNRYISNAGICSRRKADELISAGVVSVNGEVVAELGYKVDPAKDSVRYNGELLKREKMVYVLLNKPKDYITTTDDPQERRTVMHLVEKASKERIYPIGRLDRNTTGLLLMTNDGDLADKLSHPKNNITKLYQVELNKNLTQGDLNKIGFGLELEDGLIKPDSVSYVAGASKKEVGIQIHSGKNRIVRRIFEHLGYEVVKLDRSVYANLTKKDLPRGRWRYLDEAEVIQLKHLI